ncbi:MAG TPA: hypothetical protein VFS08_05500 [Gemmatimonadaceae bacterium]|nr:hypothetical protein [Gemmatimonadaceae bacterium]
MTRREPPARPTAERAEGAEPPPPCYTPQQVRFTDRHGVLWTVRCAHRLADADAAGAAGPPGALPVLIDDEGSRIAACRAGRCWLEFTSATQCRRLTLVPPRWYELSHAALAVLCEEAG